MSDSSDDHRAVSKNGKDANQDRAIRDLTAEVRSYQQHDQEAHQQINARLDSIREQVIAEAARQEVREKYGEIEQEDDRDLKKLLVRSTVSLVTALLAQGGALLGWGWAQFDEMQRGLQAVELRIVAVENGAKTAARLARQEQEIDALRARLGLKPVDRDSKDDL